MMPREFAFASAMIAGCAALFAPTFGRAAPPGASAVPVYVLTVWSDDSDDQADALTQALRAQVRNAPGLSLVDTTQSFETLAIALRCPAKPDAACLGRIGDQLHASDYVWGTLAKHKAGQVDAELHIWRRGKASADATESYAEDLKDPNDPRLQAIAARIVDNLAGTRAAGTVLIHAGAASGRVLVDGADREALEGGRARVELPAGEHTVAVRVAGYESPQQTATVSAGSDRAVEFVLSPTAKSTAGEAGGGEESSKRGGIGVRPILGYGAIAIGAGLLVAAGVEGLNWMSDKNANDKDRAAVPSNVTDVCSYPNSAPAQDACQQSKNAKTASTLGWIFTAAGAVFGGTGTWLVLSDSGKKAPPADGATAAGVPPRVELTPRLGTHAQTLELRVTF